MAFLDRVLQNIRFSKVKKFIGHDYKVLDVGSEHGDLYFYLKKNVGEYVGIDIQTKPLTETNFTLIKGKFPENLPAALNYFDAIVMLAVVEHLDEKALASLSQTSAKILKPKGLLLMTIPSPLVDVILIILRKFRLVHAETLHEHHGFKPGDMKKIISSNDFELLHHNKFELGLNNFFVFRNK
jgi:SAM-dependent methyltransferase